jgi:hypothetical protein
MTKPECRMPKELRTLNDEEILPIPICGFVHLTSLVTRQSHFDMQLSFIEMCLTSSLPICAPDSLSRNQISE